MSLRALRSRLKVADQGVADRVFARLGTLWGQPESTQRNEEALRLFTTLARSEQERGKSLEDFLKRLPPSMSKAIRVELRRLLEAKGEL